MSTASRPAAGNQQSAALASEPPTLVLPAGGSLAGTVRVPGDKSISHRALLFGAIAEGRPASRGCCLLKTPSAPPPV